MDDRQIVEFQKIRYVFYHLVHVKIGNFNLKLGIKQFSEGFYTNDWRINIKNE